MNDYPQWMTGPWPEAIPPRYLLVRTDAEFAEAERGAVDFDVLYDLRSYVPTGRPPYRPHGLKAKIRKTAGEWEATLPDRYYYASTWREVMDAVIKGMVE